MGCRDWPFYSTEIRDLGLNLYRDSGIAILFRREFGIVKLFRREYGIGHFNFSGIRDETPSYPPPERTGLYPQT